jgi:hypothetical protein
MVPAEARQPCWIITGRAGVDRLVERGTLGWGVPAERLAKLL